MAETDEMRKLVAKIRSKYPEAETNDKGRRRDVRIACGGLEDRILWLEQTIEKAEAATRR